MAARSTSTFLVQSLRSRSATARSLSTTRMDLLPRQGLPKLPPIRAPSTSTSIKKKGATERQDNLSNSSDSKSDLPWFLQDEEDVEVLKPTLQSSSSAWSPEIYLPEPLSSLHELLITGESSALIVRPDEDNGIDGFSSRKPIVYINAKEKSEDAWTDWIVVVQVKSNAGGSVSRVAREVGTFLKHVRPPTAQYTRSIASPQVEAEVEEDQAVTSIEDFLGKEAAPTPPPAGKKSTKRDEVIKPDSPSETSTERRRWQPFKIISREAQDGIRLLHGSDPEKWSRKMLSEQFKVSQESIRRILKSRWKPTASVVGRQNRRAMEREMEKRGQQKWMTEEQEEVASIRREMERNNQGVDEDEQEYRLQGEEDEDRSEDRYTHPVFFEGLVHSGEDRSHGKGKSAVTRGDGEWCLVDAGWCVVHVMTARARKQYDVESIASTKVQDSLREASVA